MTYWLYGAQNDSVEIYSDTLEVDYLNQTAYSDATGKEGKIVGSLEDDYPIFLQEVGQVFSQRIAEAIMQFEPEGVISYSMTLKLPDGTLNESFYRLSIAPHVDCIDFDSSNVRLNREGHIRTIRKLVLDEAKADRAGYDLFRLHDDFPTIVMSDRMKQAVEALNPVGMRFKPLSVSETAE